MLFILMMKLGTVAKGEEIIREVICPYSEILPFNKSAVQCGRAFNKLPHCLSLCLTSHSDSEALKARKKSFDILRYV
jgi:hypothetical protein